MDRKSFPVHGSIGDVDRDAGNHGVAARGVSAFPPEVTVQMVANFEHGGAAMHTDAIKVTDSVVPHAATHA